MFRKELKKLLAVLLILALAAGMLPVWDDGIKAYADDTTSGDWSSGEYITEPDLSGTTYTIDGPGDLAWVASQVNSGSTTFAGYTFDVTVDIDLSAHYWIPIGKNKTITFKGIFNGNGKVISGLTIGSPASPNSTLLNTGLFGFVTGSTITGVNLENAVIYSSIESPVVGGLVGEAKGLTTISDCSVTGLFYCIGSGGRIGGILGNLNDYGAGQLTVKSCYSQCAIYSPKVSYAGGLVASVFSDPSRKTNIRNCFATGSITGGGYINTSVGGFIGSCQYANIYNCYSYCAVDGKSCNTGGFAGYVYNGGLSNVYAAGSVKGLITKGGVTGEDKSSTIDMSNCYWNSTVNSDTTTYGIGNTASNSPSNKDTTALSKDYMQSEAFLSDLNTKVTGSGVSWVLDADKNGGFPRLSGIGAFGTVYKPVVVGASIGGKVRVKETLTLSYDYLDYNGYPESGSTIRWYRSANADGSGAEQIAGAEGKTYLLTDADLSKYIYAAVTPSNGYTAGVTVESGCTSMVEAPYFAGGSGVEGDPYIIENLAQLKNLSLFPNAHYSLESDVSGLDTVLCDNYTVQGPFSGDFNGNGHTVSINITGSTYDYMGMFTVIDSAGKVHGLNVTGSISGSKNLGSLAGLNKGTISDCNSSVAVSAAGNPSSPIYVGGLVSSNIGRIENCSVTGTVTASGLTGNGSDSSRAAFGGIAGDNYRLNLNSEGLITGCDADISSFSIDVSNFREVYAGGLVGTNNANGSIENSYARKGPACNLTTGNEASIVRVGGIAGYNYYAAISQCYSIGNVTAGGRCTVYAGGIVGQCANKSDSESSLISECYYYGTVSGNGNSTMDTCVGGLVGYFTSGNVNYCYSAGRAAGNGGSAGTGNIYAGGLVGYDDDGAMGYCYARGTGTAGGGNKAFNGGLYGGRKNTDDSSILNTYWNSDNSTATYGDGKNGASGDVGTALTTMHMTGAQAASYMSLPYLGTPHFVTKDNYGQNWYYPQLYVFASSTDSTVSGDSLESVTEAVYSASINPETASFDLSSQEAVSVTINWNGTAAISDIKAGGVSIGTGSYSIDKDENLLTIDGDYLKTQGPGTVSLTIEFNKGYPAVLNINITQSIPSITASPTDKAVIIGETVSFTVAAAGDGPLSYQWRKNGSDLSDDGRISGAETGELTISNVQESDEGSYTCFVSNNTGNATSSAANLTVNPAPVAPYITAQPSSIAVNYWGTATFTVEAAGDIPMTCRWLKDGIGISDGARISGASSKTLTIRDAQASDEGSYACHVTNGAGEVTSDEAVLTVNLINAAISPSTATFDLNNPADVSIAISWGSARTVTDVVYGSNNTVASAVYSIDGNTLTIGKAFLESLKLTENASEYFEISFDLGSSATLTVEAVRNYIPGSDATLSYLAVGGIEVSGFTPDQDEYDVELPSGTKPGSPGALVSAAPTDTKAKLVSITQASSLPGSAAVKVTAEDGTTEKTYTINLTLAKAPNTPPSRKSGAAAAAAASVTVNTAYTVNLGTIFEDADHDTLTYKVSVNGAGYITAAGSYSYIPGTVGLTTLVFKANDGTVDSSDTYTVTLTAVTEPVPTYALVIKAGAGGRITAGSSGDYTAGTVISIAAAADANYSFSRWTSSGGGTFSSSTSADTTFTMPAAITTITASFTYTGSPSGDGGGGSSSTGAGNSSGQAPNTTVSGNTATATTTATAAVDNSGTATAAVTQAQISDAVGKALEEAAKQGQGTEAVVEIKVEAAADAKAFEAGLPKAAVDEVANSNIDALTVSTPIADITFDGKALDTVASAATADVKISVAKVDVQTLDSETKQVVGDRPVFNFSVTSGNDTISQFGGNVSISVSYTPKPGEDTNAIVIYYINPQGGLETISNCHYDQTTGKVTFTTNHFSRYAVGYNKVTFKDVAAGSWYGKAVGFIAARGITVGTGGGNYSPEAKLTRGEFIVMLMKAYGIKPDESPTDNFADAGSTYYTAYLAAAKRLGISGGVGNNLFAPGKDISRQEMFTMIYNALNTIEALPKRSSSKKLSNFSDAGQIASWAKDAITLLAETGTIEGNDGKLYPTSTTTRAEIAQVLYNLLSK